MTEMIFPKAAPMMIRLRAAVQSQPQDFQVGWGFAGSKRFIATDPRLATHRAWLQTLFTALEAEDRDAILAALDGVREKLTQREGAARASRDYYLRTTFSRRRQGSILRDYPYAA